MIWITENIWVPQSSTALLCGLSRVQRVTAAQSENEQKDEEQTQRKESRCAFI